jgi:hypothetical protein
MLEVKLLMRGKSIIVIGFKILDRKLVAGSWGI